MKARWPVARGPLVIGGAVVLAGVVLALLSARGGGTGDLDPGDPGPDGARAVVQVLRHQGVQVRALTRSGPAVAAAGGGTLLVHRTELLGRQQLSRLAAVRPARLVLLAPTTDTLRALVPAIREGEPRPAGVSDPGCALPEAVAAGRAASGGGATYRGTGVTCYRGSLVTGRASSGVEVVVLGRADLLANDTITDDGNAALALRLLGSRPELIWYTADPLEPAERQLTIRELLPGWLPFVAVQLGLAALAAMLWRGRRLGPLVGEPLPVVVRAAETQQGRARLYRQARARDRAAAGLRAASARRLGRQLRAGSGTTAQQLVSMVAGATGRSSPAVSALLLGPAPASDAELVRLADELDDLERALTNTQRKAPA